MNFFGIVKFLRGECWLGWLRDMVIPMRKSSWRLEANGVVVQFDDIVSVGDELVDM